MTRRLALLPLVCGTGCAKDARMRWPRGIVLAGAAIIAGLIVLGLISGFLVDWLWFSSLGFAAIFWTVIAAKVALFAVVFVATAAVLWLNVALAVRVAAPRGYLRPVPLPWDTPGNNQ